MDIGNLGISIVRAKNILAKKAAQVAFGTDQRKYVSDSSLSKIGRAFSDFGIHQVRFPHLTHSKDSMESGSKYFRNTHNGDDAGLVRWITRFRGQESRVKFMKLAIKKLDNQKLLNDLAKILTRKRSYDNREAKTVNFRLLESKYYMPILLQAIKYNKPDILQIFLENRRSFSEREVHKLARVIIKKDDNTGLKTVFLDHFGPIKNL
jgi:hypothetical protein